MKKFSFKFRLYKIKILKITGFCFNHIKYGLHSFNAMKDSQHGFWLHEFVNLIFNFIYLFCITANNEKIQHNLNVAHEIK